MEQNEEPKDLRPALYVWRVEPAANHPWRSDGIHLPSTGLASVGEVPADVRPDLRVVEVLLGRLDEFLDLCFAHSADGNESWDKTEEKAVLVHPAELANGEEELIFRPSTDGDKSLLGNNVISQRWDLLKEATETRRDGDIEPVRGKPLAVFVPQRSPPWRVLGCHETFVVGERLSVGFGKDDHAVPAEDASALAEEERIVPDTHVN